MSRLPAETIAPDFLNGSTQVVYTHVTAILRVSARVEMAEELLDG